MNINTLLKLTSDIYKSEYLELLLYSIGVIVLATMLKWVLKNIIEIASNQDKTRYNFYMRVKTIFNILTVIVLIFFWGKYLTNILTLVSFVSAAFLLAIRDIIFNWFSGIYIRMHRPFKLEDRIEIDDTIGDVVNISTLYFDILEVFNKKNGQSTGIVVTFPNSFVFSHKIKNLIKGFKYIWNEMEVKVPIGSDIVKTKKELYKIINGIDYIKNLPTKMKKELSDINTSYRVYYNNFDPIIYTNIEEQYVVLTIRYLMNPKKARLIESIIWNKIYKAYKSGLIELYGGEKK